MAITSKPLSASQDFIDYMSPKKSLRKWIQQALADDDLALFFMHTDPPSVQECRYGVQFIDVDSLPKKPNSYVSVSGGSYWYQYSGSEFIGFTDAASLLSDDWLEDFEKVNQLKGTQFSHDGQSTITLVPQADTKNHKVPIRFTNPYTRSGLNFVDTGITRPYKWAVLARKSAFNPRLRSWHSGNYRDEFTGASYEADTLLFDFRGGVPLTVGEYGSEADIWLGEQLSFVSSRKTYGRSFEYPSSIEVGRVHVPQLGESTNGTV